MRRPSITSSILFVISCGLAYLLYAQANSKTGAEIHFSTAKQIDFGLGEGQWVMIEGRLVGGEKMYYPNNSYRIVCTWASMVCDQIAVEQAGPSMIAWADDNDFKVIKWDAREIVATRETTCFTKTLTYSRDTKSTLIVSEPTNVSSAQCSGASVVIQKWTIEKQPWEP